MNPEEETTTTEEETTTSEPVGDETGSEVKTVEEYLQEVIDNQNKVIEQQTTRIAEQNQQFELQKAQLEAIRQEVSEIEITATVNEEGETLVDLSPINERLDQLLEMNSNIIIGANTVTTYGVVYIPLAIIIFLLARFFFTFVKTYR